MVENTPEKGCCTSSTADEAAAEAVQGCPKSHCGKAIASSVSTAHDSDIDSSNECFPDAKTSFDNRLSPCKINIQLSPACSHDIEAITSTSTLVQANDVENFEIEKGPSQLEHLVLSVEGMTCTGCEKKLSRSLACLPAVLNPRASLVLGVAEFDYSSTSTDIDNLLQTLQHMTGFKFTKVTLTGQDLDLIVDGNIEDFPLNGELPAGVADIKLLGKTSIRVTYNPRVIGARELLLDPFFRLTKLAPLAPPPLIASGRAHVRKMLLMTLFSAVLTIPVLVMAWVWALPEHAILYGAISVGLATVVQIVVAGPFYGRSLKALLFARMIEMDLLVVLSTTTAYVYSVIAYSYLAAGKPLSTGQFFETSTLLVTLIMVGRTVSAFARQKAVESISIGSLQALTALLIDPKTQQEQEEIDSRLLQYGDIFKVKSDLSIVTDGIVTAGQTEVDESMVNGEAHLVLKKPGMSVVAGSINHSGTITVRLTHLPSENTITTIQSMVDEAKFSHAKIQKIADLVASYFVPIIVGITILIFVIWVGVGKAVRHQSATTTCIVAMTYAICVLIVSCPCAIGLAVPMVVVIAGGLAARHGLIFKTVETIEIARSISHVVFDKTGTLTQGKLSVVVEDYLTEGIDSLRGVILGLARNSKHPVSTALSTHMKTSGAQPSEVENVVSVAGSGIEGTYDGRFIRAGNPYWLGFENSPTVQKFLSQGLTLFCVSLDGELVATFGLRDLLRPEATTIINQLKNRSIEVSLVSGDNEQAVYSIAEHLAIPVTNVRWRCSPGDKQIYVKEALAATNRKNKNTVLFCGDGTNDAVALAQASIGLHMNEGTEIAQGAADAVLLRPSLDGVLFLIDLSKAFYRRVVFNFVWAFAYNLFAVLLAAGAFPRVRIPPHFAGLGEIVSVLPVIAIALQLKWAKFEDQKQELGSAGRVRRIY